MADKVQVSFDINPEVFSALQQYSEHFISEMRLAAAVKWKEIGE